MARGKKLFVCIKNNSKTTVSMYSNITGQHKFKNGFFNKDYIQFMPYMLSINVQVHVGGGQVILASC